jgi:hypothetical protein
MPWMAASQIYRDSEISGRLVFNYSITTQQGAKTKYNYLVELVTTHCNYGGYRWWLICPEINCNNRVGTLYMPYSQNYFLCRHCHDLTYESCQESHRFDRMFNSLGANMGISPEDVKELLKDWGRGK